MHIVITRPVEDSLKIITDLKATSMSDMGMVIKKTMEITKGSADGKLISELARNYLK